MTLQKYLYLLLHMFSINVTQVSKFSLFSVLSIGMKTIRLLKYG